MRSADDTAVVVDEAESVEEVGRVAAAGWAEAGPAVEWAARSAALFSVDADRTAERAAVGMGRSS
jgi:hypothetical protein